mgnify:CR=1 FL=1
MTEIIPNTDIENTEQKKLLHKKESNFRHYWNFESVIRLIPLVEDHQ